MQKENKTYWQIIRGELKTPEDLETEIRNGRYSSEEAEFLRDIFEISDSSRALPSVYDFDADSAMSVMQKNLFSKNTSGLQRFLKGRNWLVAASIFVLFGFFGLHYYLFQPVSYQNNSDSSLSIVLSDLSEVVLGPGSKLEVNRYYGLINRNVYLEGSAFFNIRPDKDQLFRVNAENSKIDVLGTRFFVEKSFETGAVTIELKEGILQLKTYSGQQLLLQDVGLVKIQSGQIKAHKLDTEMNYAWIGEPLKFDDAPLEEIIQRINKEYGYELIKLSVDKPLNCRMNTTIYPGMIDHFIEELDILFTMKYRTYKGRFEINEINCNG